MSNERAKYVRFEALALLQDIRELRGKPFVNLHVKMNLFLLISFLEEISVICNEVPVGGVGLSGKLLKFRSNFPSITIRARELIL